MNIKEQLLAKNDKQHNLVLIQFLLKRILSHQVWFYYEGQVFKNSDE